jgi:tetratricopeptide (TPR) repeat protein
VEMIRVADGVQIWVEDLLADRTRIAELEADLAARLDFRLSSLPIALGRAQIRRPPRHAMAAEISGLSSTPNGSKAHRASHERSASGLSIAAAADAAVHRVPASRSREAYEAFLRGHHAWQTAERHSMQDGLQRLSRAIELDSSLIAAKVDLIHLCVNQAFYGFMAPGVAASMVRRTADQIPDLARRAPEALPALGWIYFQQDRDLEAADRAFDMSADLPHNPWITRERCLFALSRHRISEAIALIRSAIQDDPFSPSLEGRLAWALHLDGQAVQSVEQTQKALQHYPEHQSATLYGAMILCFNGDPVRGEKIARDLASRQPYFDLASAVHAYALACAGRETEAREGLERLQWLSRERYVLKSFFPAIHVALGDDDAALVELNAANESRCPWFFQMLADPRLKPLHGRAEFQRLRTILPGMEKSVDELMSGL